MPRHGQNPMKGVKKDFTPQRVTACSIVYAPSTEGFWGQCIDIAEICLRSMRATTDVPFDLFVLDNGSCGAMRERLLAWQSEGLIQCLLLSQSNMGKAGAWNVLMPACPGEVIAYCDSDVLFRPGWLEKSLALLEAFPRAGMISAHPCRVPASLRGDLCSATLKYAELEERVSMERGDLIDAAVLADFARSVGCEGQAPYVGPYEDLLLRSNGEAAYISAGHYQFLTTKEVVRSVLPIHAEFAAGGIRGGVRQFDVRANQAGFLRLSTVDALVRHLGNRLAADEIAELQKLQVPVPRAAVATSSTSLPARALEHLASYHYGRKALERVYLRLFEALR